MSGFDFEAEFKKLLSNEAVELGDLLALEFEKAMTDQSAQVGVLSISEIQANYKIKYTNLFAIRQCLNQPPENSGKTSIQNSD